MLNRCSPCGEFPDLRVDHLRHYGPGRHKFSELRPQMLQQRIGTFVDDERPEPGPTRTGAGPLVPGQHLVDEFHHALGREKQGEHGPQNRVVAAFAAYSDQIASLGTGPGLGGANLDAIAAVDALLGIEYRLIIFTHLDGACTTAFCTKPAADTSLRFQRRINNTLEADIIHVRFETVDGTAGKAHLEFVMIGVLAKSFSSTSKAEACASIKPFGL